MFMIADAYQYADWYSATVSDEERLEYLQQIADGHVVAAYEGHTFTMHMLEPPSPTKSAL
jgi:hypothetical protein